MTRHRIEGLTEALKSIELNHTLSQLDDLRPMAPCVRQVATDAAQQLRRLRDLADRQAVEICTLLDEVEGLRAFKQSVDEALNVGDGSYRP